VIATQASYSCLEAGRVETAGGGGAAHDVYTRLFYLLFLLTNSLLRADLDDTLVPVIEQSQYSRKKVRKHPYLGHFFYPFG
jgi:hypothetical protein